MKQIELTQGKCALVDDADFEWLSQWKWCAVKPNKIWYAWTNVLNEHGGYQTGRMHRFIMDAPDGIEVDHEDGNGLNNQRSNLRLATRAQNQWNVGKRKDNTSGYKGVSMKKLPSGNQRWAAQIQVNGKPIHLGYFATPEAASEAYDAAAIKHHGSFARTNAA